MTRRLVIIAALLLSPLTSQAALPTPATCPAPDTTKPAAYQTGFNSACQQAMVTGDYDAAFLNNDLTGTAGTPSLCNRIHAPTTISADADKTQWSIGCQDGYQSGYGVYQANLQAWPTSQKPDASSICQSMTGYTGLPDAGYRAQFLSACIPSYRAAVNHPKEADATTVQDFNPAATSASDCTSFVTLIYAKKGCEAGFSRATEDFEDAFVELPAPTAAEKTFVESTTLNNCNGLLVGGGSSPSDLQEKNGIYRGCYTGYNTAKDGNPSTSGTEVKNLSNFDYRSVKHWYYAKGYKNGYNTGYQMSKCPGKVQMGIVGTPCPASGGGTVSGGGIVPLCNPSLPPNTPYVEGANPDTIPCGLNKFIELIKNIMSYLFLLSIPVAVLGIGYGGFKIMTAAGNPGKVEEGYGVMKLVVIGIVIMLISYMVVKLVFTVLGVATTVF